MRKMTVLNARALKRFLKYDADTGIFVWRDSRRGLDGRVAGYITPEGYRRVKVGAHLLMAHRLAWLYSYGMWPPGPLDHIDGDRDNNTLANLRLATPSQNGGNRRVGSNNELGIKGVRLHECGRYIARICCQGKSQYLGLFDTAEEARCRYNEVATRLFGEFSRAA